MLTVPLMSPSPSNLPFWTPLYLNYECHLSHSSIASQPPAHTQSCFQFLTSTSTVALLESSVTRGRPAAHSQAFCFFIPGLRSSEKSEPYMTQLHTLASHVVVGVLTLPFLSSTSLQFAFQHPFPLGGHIKPCVHDQG